MLYWKQGAALSALLFVLAVGTATAEKAVIQVFEGLRFPACYEPDGIDDLLATETDAQAKRLFATYECFWLYSGDTVTYVGNAMPVSVGQGQRLSMKFVMFTERGFGQGWFPVAFLVDPGKLAGAADLTGVWRTEDENYIQLNENGSSRMYEPDCQDPVASEWTYGNGILTFHFQGGGDLSEVDSVLLNAPAKPAVGDRITFAAPGRVWIKVDDDTCTA